MEVQPIGAFCSRGKFHVCDPSSNEFLTKEIIDNCRAGLWNVYGLKGDGRESMTIILLNSSAMSEGGVVVQEEDVSLPFIEAIQWNVSSVAVEVSDNENRVLDVGILDMIGIFEDSVDMYRGVEGTWLNNWTQKLEKYPLTVTGDVPGPVGCVWQLAHAGGSLKRKVIVDKARDLGSDSVWALRLRCE